MTWSRAVIACDSPEAFAAALRSERGRRVDPDQDLRRWALEQTAASVNAPLHRRLDALQIGGAAGPGGRTIST
jgi:hypothetical protein